MKKDDGETLPSSAAYVRDTTPKVSATFTVETLGFLPYLYVKARASGPGGIAVPETVAICYGNTASLAETPCTGQLPYTVMYYDRTGNEAPPFQLDWEMSFDNGATWRSAGNTKSTVYVTLAQPDPTALTQETLYYIACKQAKEKTTENGAIDAIWQHFAGLEVKNVNGMPLTYYGTYNLTDFYTYTDVLLKYGTGKCEAWVKFFLDVLKIHGVRQPNNFAEIVPVNPNESFLVKNWTFPVSGSTGNSEYPYVNVLPQLDPNEYIGKTNYVWHFADVTDALGMKGQNNPNPHSIFANHALAVVNELYYDPSYGRIFADLQKFDEQAIDGYFVKIPVQQNGVTYSAFVIRTNDLSKVDLKESSRISY